MVQIRQQLVLELMREADISTVQEIEREIFATPWPRNAYYRELASRSSAHYVILRQEGNLEKPASFKGSELDPSIIGYGGMWRMYDEAHVTTIGVQAAYDMGAKWVTLEVRTTNENAMRMYEAFGFKVIGRRKGYYTDNGEDAIVMWSDSIHSPRFRRAYEANLERIDADVRGLRRELITREDQQ
jgi:ribosomal-protein-alanine N-acetyltransferase